MAKLTGSELRRVIARRKAIQARQGNGTVVPATRNEGLGGMHPKLLAQCVEAAGFVEHRA